MSVIQLLFYSENPFRNLSVAKKNGLRAPHKAVLLLNVMDLIAVSEIVGGKVL